MQYGHNINYYLLNLKEKEMYQSENIAELATALSKAQGEMQPAIKDSVNPFFKSKYADLGSVWDAARPVLSKNGLCVMQSTEMQGEKIVMITTLAHTSGQWVRSLLPLNPSKNDSQGVGAAITYLRRYSLSALVGVVCDDDDDGETAVGRGKQNMHSLPSLNQENKHDLQNKTSKIDHFESAPHQTPPSEPKISKEQLEEILVLFAETDDTFKENYHEHMKKSWNVEEYSDLPLRAYKPTIIGIKNNIRMNQDKKKVI